jgi:hypothetical protein
LLQPNDKIRPLFKLQPEGLKIMVSKKKQPKQTRKQELGDYGEDRARELLLRKGFDLVEKMPKKFPFFDLMVKRGARRLLISVRTRNKFRADGALKTDNYNLYTKRGHFEAAEKIAKFFGAKIHWVAVTVDTKAKTFSAYTGNVSELPSPNYIPMHPTKHVPEHDCLATDVPDKTILRTWNNIVVRSRARKSAKANSQVPATS